jgi:Tfp pilus assembly protein PilN
MKIAVTLCASLGGLTATVAGLAALDAHARGGSQPFFPPALSWWMAVAWIPALVGLLLLFEKGGPAAAWAFGSCPLGCAILSLPHWRIAGASLLFCGFLTLAAGLSLMSPAAGFDGWIVPQEKPRPLPWLGGAVLLSTLAFAGLQIYFADRVDAREQEAETIAREVAGLRGIVAEVQAYKAKRSRLERESETLYQSRHSFGKLTALRTLDTVETGKDVWIETIVVMEHRFELTLTAPSLDAAAAVQNRLSAIPGIGATKISPGGEAPAPGRHRYVVKGDLNEDKIPAEPRK